MEWFALIWMASVNCSYESSRLWKSQKALPSLENYIIVYTTNFIRVPLLLKRKFSIFPRSKLSKLPLFFHVNANYKSAFRITNEYRSFFCDVRRECQPWLTSFDKTGSALTLLTQFYEHTRTLIEISCDALTSATHTDDSSSTTI